MPHESLNSTERELESALRALAPAAPTARVSPEAIAFALGRASARPQVFAWQSIAAVLAVACGASILLHTAGTVGSGALAPTINHLANQPGPSPAPLALPRITDPGAITSPFSSPVGSAYLTMRSRVNDRGLIAVPEPVSMAAAAPRSAEVETAGGTAPSPSSAPGEPRVSPILRSILFLRGA